MEILDVYNAAGELMGTLERGRAHAKDAGVYHKCVYIWVINSSGEVLLEQRALCKSNPGKWDTGVVEHAWTGETMLEACVRGVREELGVETSEDEYIFINETLNGFGWEFRIHYVLYKDIALGDMDLQENEVAQVKWLSLDEYKQFICTDAFIVHTREYKDFVVREIEAAFNKLKV